MLKWGVLLLYMVLSGYGLLKLKAAGSIYSSAFLVGFAAYGGGFVIWLYMLRQFPLSVIFPTAAGGLIVTTQILGFFFLAEPISASQMAGTALVVIGMVLIFSFH